MTVRRRSRGATAAVLVALTGGCSGGGHDRSASGSSPAPTPAPSRGAPADPAATAAAATTLRQALTPPPLPGFGIPLTNLGAQTRSITARLHLSPGLYDGIAVLDKTCGAASPQPDRSGGQVYDDGSTRITIGGNGEGTYRNAQLRITVSGHGDGTLADTGRRVAVHADGSGTLVTPTQRFTINPDGSGTVETPQLRVTVDGHGNGTYTAGAARVRVVKGAVAAVTGAGPAEAAGVAMVLAGALPRFPAVPAVGPLGPTTARSCGTIIRLNANVLFAFDDARVQGGTAAALLTRVARLLTALKSPPIAVNGYTDSVGTAAYNQALSLHRAAAVRDALAAQGVPRESMSANGFGEADPVRPGTTASGQDDPDARALDRRVELVLGSGG